MYLYGASGHGKVIAEIAEENNLIIKAFVDQDETKKKLLQYDVLNKVPDDDANVIISIGNNLVRKKIALLHQNFNYFKLFHPKAIISKRCIADEGTVIMGGVTVNSGVVIGKHCIVNTNASVDHDCIVGDFVHISPGASIAGDVKIGEGTHVGIGSSIIQGVKIGKWCTIGAGAVIIKDVPNGATVVGNPGRIIKIKNINTF